MRTVYRAARNACSWYERAGDALAKHFKATRPLVRQHDLAVESLYEGHAQMDAAVLALEAAVGG